MTTANVIQVTADNQEELLQYLYDQSAMTFEGLSPDSFNDWAADVDSKLGLKKPDVYEISGGLMNGFYGLTGTNAYPDDLTIACIPLDNVKGNPVMYRLQMGCRWFDDVVENNRYRQEHMN